MSFNILPGKGQPISFVDIYNALNDSGARYGGTTHNGSVPISLNSFRSTGVVESELEGALIATEDRKFNYVDATSGSSINYSDYIVTNVGARPGYNSGLPHNLNFWPTPTDMDGDGSDDEDTEDVSDPTNAWISSVPEPNSSYDYMSGNKGDHNTFSFMLLHNSSKKELTILWKRSSEGNYDTLYMYELADNVSTDFTAPNKYSRILINSTSTSEDVNSGSLNSSAEYIAIFYVKDGSQNIEDDRAYIKIAEGDSGLIPKNLASNTVSSSNIIRDGQSINLDQTTKGQIYYPESGFRFYDNGGSSDFVDDNSDGIITFDSGNDNLRLRLTFNSFRFPASNDIVQPGQLSIKDGDFSSLSNINVAWMIDPPFGKQDPSGIDWVKPGHVLPYSSSVAGVNGETYTTLGRYVQFSYTNNVEPSTNFNFDSYPSEGWDISLQVVNLSNQPSFNIISGLNYPLSINDDFSGRTKTHDTTIEITNLAGAATTITTTNTNAAVIKLNLLTNNSSSVISTNNSFTTSDITVISTIGNETNQATVSNLITEGENAFRADITPVGTLARQLNVYVKDNKFFAGGKIWNSRSNLAPNSLRLQLNFPELTITSNDVTNGGTTTNQTIPFTITCQHNFDGLIANEIELVNCVLTTGPNTINGKQKQISVNASSIGNVSITIGSGTIFESDTGNRFENPVSTLFSYSYALAPPGPSWSDISQLAISLNGLQIDDNASHYNTILNASPNFYVFARVSTTKKAEDLIGRTQGGLSIKTEPCFVYSSSGGESNVSNVLSTGNQIKYLTGGSELETLAGSGVPVGVTWSLFDSKPWYGIAWYDSNGFRGITVSVFTGQQINDSGSVTGVITGRAIQHTRDFFQEQGSRLYYQIYAITFGPDGSVLDADTTGSTGWEFSNNMSGSSSTLGYYSQTRFSGDDGLWGFTMGSQTDGNFPGLELRQNSSSRSYGLQNYNAGDTTSTFTRLYWDDNGNQAGSIATPPTDNNIIGYIFTGDRTALGEGGN
tara:strand:+ start:795 stop:3812 length:3018 start_codon:yes stop_codon:yes gene_type:complete